ncbi:hypothetical protein A3Q56_06887 [Intoshia linei]|uniref:Uncharacterized protein n=1 Tax=Intoshia linei TaxID=1819745 RepID=A0A177ATP8_9BILA|nr:hypothetical protein A3Q56_06887 [Intoshia linei]
MEYIKIKKLSIVTLDQSLKKMFPPMCEKSRLKSKIIITISEHYDVQSLISIFVDGAGPFALYENKGFLKLISNHI